MTAGWSCGRDAKEATMWMWEGRALAVLGELLELADDCELPRDRAVRFLQEALSADAVVQQA
ncbi:hypothetical protein [Mycobacterium intracellulare]|nr:hypothetical protein [Mycobacterium intracellulare]MCA2276769.1 hypothetical protein [Mycobacterium intracellulare]MCA2328317.1 hypothetical protein [Mycobacterium intracellulare]UEB25362.1 hypothetical protein LK403_03755 [Mycobacterium intracellulare]UQC06993.1 hypothetical protein KN251_23185 [Mycobacterium intracellulare ATCC 13950]